MQPKNDMVELVHDTLEAECVQCGRKWKAEAKNRSTLYTEDGAVADAHEDIHEHVMETAHDVKHVTTHHTKAEYTWGENYEPMPFGTS